MYFHLQSQMDMGLYASKMQKLPKGLLKEV